MHCFEAHAAREFWFCCALLSWSFTSTLIFSFHLPKSGRLAYRYFAALSYFSLDDFFIQIMHKWWCKNQAMTHSVVWTGQWKALFYMGSFSFAFKANGIASLGRFLFFNWLRSWEEYKEVKRMSLGPASAVKVGKWMRKVKCRRWRLARFSLLNFPFRAKNHGGVQRKDKNAVKRNHPRRKVSRAISYTYWHHSTTLNCRAKILIIRKQTILPGRYE